MRAAPALTRLTASILFIEQPIARKAALEADFRHIALGLPVIIDESDGTLDTFVAARERGYSGISSKTCKGLYKSILNAARCARWNVEQSAVNQEGKCSADLGIGLAKLSVKLLAKKTTRLFGN